MNSRVVLIALIALLVGLVLGGGWGMMQTEEANQQLAAVTQEKDQAVQSANRLRKMAEDAAKKYGAELGKLVNAVDIPAAAAPQPGAEAQPAAATPPDFTKLIDSARAILAARDGVRSSFDGMRAATNGELDQLALELGNPAPNGEKIQELLKALKQNWPGKQQQLDAASRQLLVDLGVLAAPKPEAAPAAAAPAPAAPLAPAEKK